MIAGSDAVGNLDRETHGHSRADAPEQPQGGGNKSHRGGIIGSETPHHCSVDVLHHDTGELSHHGRPRQLGCKLQLLCKRKLLSGTYLINQQTSVNYNFNPLNRERTSRNNGRGQAMLSLMKRSSPYMAPPLIFTLQSRSTTSANSVPVIPSGRTSIQGR